MQPLHIPPSIVCPPVHNPLHSTRMPVPYASALQTVRASRQLQTAVVGAFDDDSDFMWLDQENNSSSIAKGCGQLRKDAENKQAVRMFNFMYFRVRTADYHSILSGLVHQANPYSEESLRQWTHSYRFRIHKDAPLKGALQAFASRLGFDRDQNIVFCQDGFYGEPLAGSVRNSTEIPYRLVHSEGTANACGLSNGSSIFVSRVTPEERRVVSTVLRLEGEADSATLACPELLTTISLESCK